MTPGDRPVLGVSQLARALKLSLDERFSTVWVRGEVSNFRAYGSGHWYFTLKDASAQLKCVMFARENRRVRQRPSDGDEVLVRARVDLYSKRGDLQLVCASMEAAGLGRLQAEFEALKLRLQAEGLFAVDRKQPLPAVPRRIGIVTSPQAAALQDMLRILGQRDPSLSIEVAPARVQGAGAGEEIAAALRLLESRRPDVILCGRGGGSLEDLWAFNEEVVVRAVAACSIPIVVGVGHEIDITLAELAADVRAPTPTAAAELAVPVRAELELAVEDLRRRLLTALTRGLADRRAHVARERRRLGSPRRHLDQLSQRLDEAKERLAVQASRLLKRRWQASRALEVRLRLAHPGRRLARQQEQLTLLQQRLAAAAVAGLLARRRELEGRRRALRALGPLQSLNRGWSLATREDDGTVLRSAAELSPGDALRVRLARGAVACTVRNVIDDDDLDLRGRPRS